MDDSHGFGIPHTDVWNGYTVDTTGGCVEGVSEGGKEGGREGGRGQGRGEGRYWVARLEGVRRDVTGRKERKEGRKKGGRGKWKG